MKKSGTIMGRSSSTASFVHKLPLVDGRQLSVIEWWASPLQRQSYLALSQLAIDVLSAFVMSAESARTFSSARRTTS